jgi:XamI restriction endonuclease
MNRQPPRYSKKQLASDAEISAAAFRKERLAPTEAWKSHYTKSHELFTALFEKLDALAPEGITSATLASVYSGKLGEALRYLSGPPISDDDLKVLSEVASFAPGIISTDAVKLKKVYSVIEKTIDPYRFPWVLEKRAPNEIEKSAALLASSVLLAAQRMSTARRGDGKDMQESLLKEFLTKLKYKEVPRAAITTLVQGPMKREFCGESKLGDRKADVILRLNDTRLMPIECKVSNSATNSVKRLNNDAAVKAVYWIKAFGHDQVVPAALISGVFKVGNLMQAQDAGLTLFWSHDLPRLSRFISSIKEQ